MFAAPLATGRNSRLAGSTNKKTVAIRRFRAEDLPQLVEAVRESLPEITSWMSWCKEDYSAEDAATFLGQSPHQWQSGDRYDFAILEPGPGKLLGSIGLSQINREH